MGSKFFKSSDPSDLNEIRRYLNYDTKENTAYTVDHFVSYWYREIHCINGITKIIAKYAGDDVGRIWEYKDGIKVMLIGDGAVRKTCMAMTYSTGHFPKDYIPTCFDNHTILKRVGAYNVTVRLWDHGGGEDYGRLRPLSYPHTDVFIVCFSIGYRNYANNVSTKWVPELRGKGEFGYDDWDLETPIILCGTKKDLRELDDERYRGNIVENRTFGEKLAKEVGAVEYVECSSKEMDGVDHVFERAAVAAIMHRERKKLK